MNHHFQNVQEKLVSWSEASVLIKEWNSEGKKVSFTNGCFDLIHPGHIQYLAQSADLGDKLVIGLNTDASVKLIKGNNRPINNEQVRALMLCAFEFVDLVVLFEDETPYKLIQILQPDFLVKGSDYKIEEIAGFDIVMAKGGEVVTIDFVEGYSSSSIIQKIQNFG